MKRLLGAALVCVWLAGSGFGARAESALDDSERAPKADKCEKVSTEAVYRAYGYDHEVAIENKCPKPIIAA